MGDAVDDISEAKDGAEVKEKGEVPETVAGEKTEEESQKADAEQSAESKEEKKEEEEESGKAGEKAANENAVVTGDQHSDAEIPESAMRMPQNEPRPLEDEEASYSALRGKANTPASVFTDPADGRNTRNMSSR